MEESIMSKNVIIISTSLRKNSNSEALATAFAAGAREAGHVVEQITLRDKTINFCKGCLACQKTQHHQNGYSSGQQMKKQADRISDKGDLKNPSAGKAV